jgi:biopolymer transport protein ExbD
MITSTLPPTAQRRNYSAPFNFTTALRRPDINLPLLPVLDLCVLALLFSLLFTRFVALPGVAVSMPETTLRLSPAAERMVVLTISPGERFYFAGSVYEMGGLTVGFERFMQRHPEENPVLMLRIDGALSSRNLMRIIELASNAGFQEIQILAETSPTQDELFQPNQLPNDSLRLR